MSKNKTAIFHEIRHVVSVGIAKLVSADEHLLIISEPESNQTFWYRSLEQMVNCEQLWSSTVSFLGQNSLRRNNLPCLSAPKGDMLLFAGRRKHSTVWRTAAHSDRRLLVFSFSARFLAPIYRLYNQLGPTIYKAH